MAGAHASLTPLILQRLVEDGSLIRVRVEDETLLSLDAIQKWIEDSVVLVYAGSSEDLEPTTAPATPDEPATESSPLTGGYL